MKQNESHVVITPALRALFEVSRQQCRVLWFSAPCGLGKTRAARALLAGHTVCACSAAEPDFISSLEYENCDAVYRRFSPPMRRFCASSHRVRLIWTRCAARVPVRPATHRPP